MRFSGFFINRNFLFENFVSLLKKKYFQKITKIILIFFLYFQTVCFFEKRKIYFQVNF